MAQTEKQNRLQIKITKKVLINKSFIKMSEWMKIHNPIYIVLNQNFKI